MALETLTRIATSYDDHDILHQISPKTPDGEGRLRPDIMTRSQRILSSEPTTGSVQTSFSACSPFPPPNIQILFR